MYSLNARDHFNCSPLLFSWPAPQNRCGRTEGGNKIIIITIIIIINYYHYYYYYHISKVDMIATNDQIVNCNWVSLNKQCGCTVVILWLLTYLLTFGHRVYTSCLSLFSRDSLHLLSVCRYNIDRRLESFITTSLHAAVLIAVAKCSGETVRSRPHVYRNRIGAITTHTNKSVYCARAVEQWT